MADESKNSDIDDWLEDLEEDKFSAKAEESSDEMGQDDIDALLGGGGGAAPTVAAPSMESAAGDFNELDQSDIDSLLGGGSTPAPAAAAAPAMESAAGDFNELDQSDIDSLLGGGSSPAPEAAAPASESGGSGFDGLDQSDIDGLFAEPAPSKPDDGSGAPSQDDVDQLFSPGGWNESDGAETVSFDEVVKNQAESAKVEDDEPFGLAGEAAFDDDEFDFGDLPDIPDEIGEVAQAGGKEDEEDIFAPAKSGAAANDLAAFLDDSTSSGITPGRPAASAKKGRKGFIPPASMSRKVMTMGAFCLILLMGGYWYLNGGGGKHAIHVPGQRLAAKQPGKSIAKAPVPTTPPPVAAVNAAPISVGAVLKMSRPGEAVPVKLSATDKENAPLRYEIVTPPRFGRLSGTVPDLTYLPGKDFPGEDSFEFRASDGKEASATAKVTITGGGEPAKVETAQAAPEPEKPAAPKRPVVSARNIRLQVASTSPLLIDWKKIWAGSNRRPFANDVSVEVFAKGLRGGQLSRIDQSSHRYEPDRQFGGREVLQYRFSRAGISSGLRNLIIDVKHGDLPPKLHLQPLEAGRAYQAGESLVLDASRTWDDFPETMTFRWEQVGGVPVHMEARNEEGSIVSFVVPSTFYREENPSLLIRVSAIDQSGQRSSKEVKIPIASKRGNPLWNGLANGGVRMELSGAGADAGRRADVSLRPALN